MLLSRLKLRSWVPTLLPYSLCSATHFLQQVFCCYWQPYCYRRYRYAPLPALYSRALLKPMMLGASTRNTLICIPTALETLKDDLKVKGEPCDLFIPIGFATIRFGTILYFVIATLFMGMLMGRTFSMIDLGLVAVFSVAASFATLGVTGLAALAPLAVVLRPFGLSYEVAVPLMIIIDPIANMIRVMLNVAINCTIPALAAGRETTQALQPST